MRIGVGHLFTAFESPEFLGHCWVTPSQSLDGKVLRFVVREPKIVFRSQKGFLGLLKMVDSLVNLLNGRLEALGGEFVVTGEPALELIEFVLEIRDINMLLLH